MENKLHIIVGGCVGTGKSSIAQLIQKTLEDVGISVTLEDDSVSDAGTLDDRLKSVCARNTNVTIETQQLIRTQ